MSRTAGLIALLDSVLSPPSLYSKASPPPLPSNAEFPYLVIKEIGGPDLTAMEGRTGLGRKLMQIECWSPDYETANSLRDAVKDVLGGVGSVGYKGTAGSEIIAGSTHSSDHDLYNGVLELHQLITAYLIWWEV